MALRCSLVTALLLAVSITGAAAQTGGLRVVVNDETDGPVPGATVVLTHATGGAESTMLSDQGGEALFPVLPAGKGYAVDVSFPGYARIRLSDLRVRLAETQTVRVTLTEEQQETVLVRGEVDVVDLEKIGTTTKFSDAFIQDLPVLGRFYQNMLTLAPGVLDADEDGNPNVHGARTRDFKAIVSGVSNQDPLTGQWLSYVNPDSIEEIEVITAGAGAEYGRAQGGFARIIQKQGNNDVEGVVGVIYRTSDLDGAGASDVAFVPEFQWFQPSVQVTGPIVKDRLWFRVSHQYLVLDEPVNLLNQLVVAERRQWIHSDQLTWQISPRNKLALQYQYDPLERTNVDIDSRIRPESSRRLETGAPTTTLTWTAPVSPKLLVESLASYQDYHQNIYPMTTGVPNSCIRGLEFAENAYCLDLDSGLGSGSYYQTWLDNRQRLTVKSTGTLYAGRLWGANHQLKFGFSIENERYQRELNRQPDMSLFPVEEVVEGRKPGFKPRTVLSARFAVPVFTSARATGTTYALFVEDQIKPLSNLILTVGARLDIEDINSNGIRPFDPLAQSEEFLAIAEEIDALPIIPEEKLARQQLALQQLFTAYEGLQDFVVALEDQMGLPLSAGAPALQSSFWLTTRRPGNIALTNNNFSPRLALAWDPWNDGKTKFALSAGRYYDKIFLAVPLIELEPPTTSVLFGTFFFQGEHFVDPDPGPVNPALNVQIVDRNLRTPYKDEYTFSFEREIATETSIKLTYIHSDFKDQLQDIDINKVPGDYGQCVVQNPPTQNLAIVAVPGEGHVLTDQFTGETYIDTDPGPGDGRLDDCVGRIVLRGEIQGTFSTKDNLLVRPDGILDLYALNPAWGNVHLVGNFNTAKYRAYVLEIVRRLHRNWELEASYAYSTAEGDAEDFLLALGDDRTTVVDERGYLSYDQRHVAKVNATTITPWGLRLGGAITWQSGLPYSVVTRDLSFDTAPPVYGSLASPEPFLRTRYPSRQRNDQRNRSFWNFDVRIAKEFNFKGVNLQITGEVFNLLNDDTLVVTERLHQVNAGFRRFGRRYQLGARLAF